MFQECKVGISSCLSHSISLASYQVDSCSCSLYSRNLFRGLPYGLSSFCKACIFWSLPCSSMVTVFRLTSQMLPWKICARSLNSPRWDALHFTLTSISSLDVQGTSDKSLTCRMTLSQLAYLWTPLSEWNEKTGAVSILVFKAKVFWRFLIHALTA